MVILAGAPSADPVALVSISAMSGVLLGERMSCFAVESVTFQNLSGRHPDSDLGAKSPPRLDSHHPPQCPHCEPAKIVQWNPGDGPLRIGGNPERADVGAGLVEPPIQEIAFLKPVRRNGVIHDRRWFISQSLAGCNQPMTELAILTLLRMPAIGAGTQVGTEAPMLFKDLL